MKFTVDRSKWFRGQGERNSRLLTDSGKMCCLGFYSQACGITDDEMRCISSPGSLNRRPSGFECLVTGSKVNTDICIGLMMTNDDVSIGDRAREERLTRLLAAIGVEVEFVDGGES